MNTFEELKAIITEVLQAKEVSLETNLRDDLGADSIDLTEIIMGVEEKFEIEIETEAIIDVKTVQDVVNYIDDKLK